MHHKEDKHGNAINTKIQNFSMIQHLISYHKARNDIFQEVEFKSSTVIQANGLTHSL